MPRCEIDLRVGGEYLFLSRAADGEEYPFRGVYREIVPPERLVYTQRLVIEPYAHQELVITMDFLEHDGRTTVMRSLLFDSVESRDAMVEGGMQEGAAETLDRLAEYLATLTRE